MFLKQGIISFFIISEFDPNVRNRIVLKTYPKSADHRSFHAGWFKLFDWLEYHPGKNCAFCYACRVFGTSETKELTFGRNGFSDWKNAMGKRNGFTLHNESIAHKICMTKWNEYKARMNKNVEVSTLVNDDVLAKNRYYVQSIFDMIKFLVVNQLPLRGSYNEEEHVEKGLFQAFFQYTIKKDEKLAECARIIPKNATYLSPEIQNEMIECMANCVKAEIVDDIKNADIPFFCVMADGTRDRNNQEAFAIVLRFVKEGNVVESVLTVEEAKALTATHLSELILKTLKNNDIDVSHLLCQCYDGATVMRGWKGGVQSLIEQALNRPVPYVHCFNHQFHLIVVHIVKEIPEVKQYFDYCTVIHKIFSTFKFKSYYDGHRTSRLLEQRWTGHLRVTEIIFTNYSIMLEALESAITNEIDELDGCMVVECTGLLNIMKSLSFRFIMCVMLKLLKTLEPVDALLQNKESGLASSLPVIHSVYASIQDYRSDGVYQEILDQCNHLLPDNEENFTNTRTRTSCKRKKKPNHRFADYICTESSGLYHISGSSRDDAVDDDDYKRIFLEILDLVLGEMNDRFVKDKSLFDIIDKVYNFSFQNIQELEELFKLNTNIQKPSQEEIICVKRYFADNNIATKNYLTELYKQKVAFKKTYELYSTICVFACSSSTCEATFSVLNRILTPFRQSMLFGRESNLTLLPYERKRTEKIEVENFLRAFNKQSRRLQLY